ncbi:MAG: cysteine desulfurase family protein [Microbacteriaceae bacterium]
MAYFDFAATSPMPEVVIDAWTSAVHQRGNASATHRDGQKSRLLWEEGRDKIAAAIGARAFDVTLTGSGTEAINLAIKGLFWGRNGTPAAREPEAELPKPRILSTEVEHHAALDALHWLAEAEGAVIDFVRVDEDGTVDLADLAAKLGPDVALFTTLWTNNEVGTIQPVADIVALATEHGVPVHLDAVATLGYTLIDFDNSGLAALSVSAHKVGGPVGVGALAVARSAAIVPLIHGGSQQRLRSGSLDAAGVFAAGVAAELATADVAGKAAKLTALRDKLASGILAAIPTATIRGHRTNRSPGNLHITIPGLDSASALFLLDEAGYAVSAGSACQAGVQSSSHVLRAMGVDPSHGPLRFTLGLSNTDAEIDALLELLPSVVARTTR